MNLVSKLRITEANTGSENERERERLEIKGVFENYLGELFAIPCPAAKQDQKHEEKKERPMPFMAINATTSSSFHQTAKQGVTNALSEKRKLQQQESNIHDFQLTQQRP